MWLSFRSGFYRLTFQDMHGTSLGFNQPDFGFTLTYRLFGALTWFGWLVHRPFWTVLLDILVSPFKHRIRKWILQAGFSRHAWYLPWIWPAGFSDLLYTIAFWRLDSVWLAGLPSLFGPSFLDILDSPFGWSVELPGLPSFLDILDSPFGYRIRRL